MAAKRQEELLNKRKFYEGRISHIESLLGDIDSSTLDTDLQSALDRLNDIFSKFEKIQIELEIMDESKYKTEGFAIEDKYLDLTKSIKRNIARLQKSNNQQGKGENSKQIETNQHLSLPKINLPSFSGDYSSWLNFKDIYVNLIHDNNELNEIRKFYYLKGALKGDAALLIANIECSTANYAVAWKVLVDRFDNKTIIANSHLNAIFELPKVNKNSGSSLRAMLNLFAQHYNSLEALKLPNLLDSFLIFFISQKLDFDTRKEFELQGKTAEFPTIKEFLDYLNKRCQAWEILQQRDTTNSFKSDKRNFACSATEVENTNSNCPMCNNKHRLSKCGKFYKLSVSEKRKFVEGKKLCFLCLGTGHIYATCSATLCSKCNQRHHKMLHTAFANSLVYARQNSQTVNGSSENNASEPSVNIVANTSYSCCVKEGVQVSVPQFGGDDNLVLLGTAAVNVIDADGIRYPCRALLDSASERNFITSKLAEKLKMTGTQSNWSVCGVGGLTSPVDTVLSLTVESRLNDFCFKTEFGVMKCITSDRPKVSFSNKLLKWPTFVKLADPKFNIRGDIDMLIGAEVYYSLLQSGKIELGFDKPVLHNTHLGWVFGGTLKGNVNSLESSVCHAVTVSSSNEDVTDLIASFWRLEEYSSTKFLSADEMRCEKLFLDTVSRDEEGRYEVDLPIIEEKLSILGNSYPLAMKCFLSLEKKFKNNVEFFERYKKFIHEFIDLGHAYEVPRISDSIEHAQRLEYYMPHHAVIREDKSSTKLRVVFNASAPSDTGVSLNDIMLVGPVVQPDLFSVLIRFRSYEYAIITDITMMYRMIKVKEKYQPLQRILWRDSPDQEVKCLQLNRVTYGTASASYLATRSLVQLVKDEGVNFPFACRALATNTYMDDIITGASDYASAVRLRDELVAILRKGKFDLHKWYSNDKRLLQDIPEDKREQCSFILKDGTASLKALGMMWDPSEDLFIMSYSKLSDNKQNTKREILSEISKIFDPLGIISPVCVLGKLIMQMIWKQNLSWDSVVPDGILDIWSSFKKNMKYIENISVPRLLIGNNAVSFQLHGFADSSLKAYGCAIYLRSKDLHNNCTTHLICSKSRVAPIKTVTLPRLELCASLLLARFMSSVQKSFPRTFDTCFYWTDSMITLAWIKSDASRWNMFVANRVAEIQELSSKNAWYHVRSADNPADIVSRGMEPQLLKKSELWFNGPAFLKQDELSWNTDYSPVDGNVPEAKVVSNAVNVRIEKPNELYLFFNRISSFPKLLRVIAYVLRFAFNCRNNVSRTHGNLTTDELHSATVVIVRLLQQTSFQNELNVLSKNAMSQKEFGKSKLRFLTPFIDKDGLIRVGGRLKHATHISEAQRHPFILPYSSHVTELIVRHEHERLLHAGAQSTLASLRQRFWILNGRNAVRFMIHKCNRCFRYNAYSSSQIMSDLPGVRITPTRPFLSVGLDYAGPIEIKQSRIRKSILTKGYICLFICMSTKAIHVELVSDMTTETFLAAFKRFVSRRGKVLNVYSDNGTTFKGANNELNSLYNMFRSENSASIVRDTMSLQGVNWNYIPSYSPHWGGLWENGVKLIKHHLKRIMGNTQLTYEELNTLLVQIEGIVNSRPLVSLSSDPNDYNVLTPAHFLINDTVVALPDRADLTELPINRLRAWEQITQLKQHFWKRWNNEYLNSLQKRTKWLYEQTNIKTGDLVLIKENKIPPSQWCLARVVELFPGKDKRVRAVSVKTQSGNVYSRSITKLCPLPSQ